MKIQRVYVDTSVIGGCFDSEFATWSMGLLKDFRKGTFKALLSEIIETEIQNAPKAVQSLLDELFTLDAERLIVTDDTLDLAEVYLKRQIVTRKFLVMRCILHWRRSPKQMCW